MAERKERDDERTVREQLDEPGGKSDWEQTAGAMPTDAEKDPKDHEPRKSDMSVRKGDPGKNAPR